MKNNYIILAIIVLTSVAVIIFLRFGKNGSQEIRQNPTDTPQEMLSNKPTAKTPLLQYNPKGTSWQYNTGTLSFDDGKYFMSFGCNKLSGEYKIEKTTLNFGPALTTRMGCPQEIAKKEVEFTSKIVKMHSFITNANGAVLSGEGEEMILSGN